MSVAPPGADAPVADGWWCLDVTQGGRLVRLGPDLSERWSVAVAIQPLHLVPVPGEERVWLASATQPHARRYGPGGQLELDLEDLPLSGLDRGLAWGVRPASPGRRGPRASGGVLLVAPGALLHLDAAGQLAPGQGGFDYLVDVAGRP